MSNKEISLKLQSLPASLQKEAMDYIEYLIVKYKPAKTKKGSKKAKLKFDWEGGLSDLKKNYTSVELQHLANELR